MEVIARAAILTLGILALAAGTYLDDDSIRPATAGDRNRHQNA